MCLPSSLSDGIVFIAWYKYNQKVPIKLCYYCSTKLDMLEVSASWLFHVAMNILWERKYLVSDSFYSAATHRAGNLPDLSKIKSVACPSLCSFLPQIRRCSALLRFPCSLGEWVDSRDVWGALSDPNERPKPEGWPLTSSAPPLLALCSSGRPWGRCAGGLPSGLST